MQSTLDVKQTVIGVRAPGALALALWHWLSGTGSLALALWHWLSGTGSLALALWHWLSGTGSLALALWISITAEADLDPGHCFATPISFKAAQLLFEPASQRSVELNGAD